MKIAQLYPKAYIIRQKRPKQSLMFFIIKIAFQRADFILLKSLIYKE
jgi:hypothetical protein